MAFATAQYCERINDEGVQKEMCSLLLERDSVAFSKINSRIPQGFQNSALWRNYVGCWKLQNDSLFLDSVLVECMSDEDYSFKSIKIDDIFADHRTGSGYFSNWVNDTLRVVSGEIINYVHMGWMSRWENEELIVVENGVVKDRRRMTSRIVNPGLNLEELKQQLDSLDVGEIPVTMLFSINYTGFDDDGNPEGCYIDIDRGSGDQAIDKRVADALGAFMLRNRPIPIYYIDGQYVSEEYVIPILPRKSSTEPQLIENVKSGSTSES